MIGANVGIAVGVLVADSAVGIKVDGEEGVGLAVKSSAQHRTEAVASLSNSH